MNNKYNKNLKFYVIFYNFSNFVIFDLFNQIQIIFYILAPKAHRFNLHFSANDFLDPNIQDPILHL